MAGKNNMKQETEQYDRLQHQQADSKNKLDKIRWNILLCLFVYAFSTIGGLIITYFFEAPVFPIAMIYTLGIILVSKYTDGFIYGIVFCITMVISVNYFFTFPYFKIDFSLAGYEVAFLSIFCVALLACAVVAIIKKNEKRKEEMNKNIIETQKEKMRANLLRAISHDLRTPLTGIIGNSSYYVEMHDQITENEKVAIVESIQKDAKWLLGMAENLLAITRINNETAQVAKTLESVDDVIGSSISRFKDHFRDAQVSVKIPDEIIFVMMDPMLIQQVLINLLQNAYQHANSNEKIELVVESDDDKVVFHVRDYGEGIDEKKIAMIFEGNAVQDIKPDSDGKKGMGIGLHICKTIIRAHNGNIYACNRKDGAEFVFSLPKEKED